MSPIERLPTEIVQYIAELCTWDSAPPENGFVSEIDVQRYKSKGKWHLASYARYHAAFARTSRHFYDILNRQLYARNMSRDPEFYSCLRWAVYHNRLETIKRAHQYRLDLSSYGPVPCTVELADGDGWPRSYMKVNGVLMPNPNRGCLSYEFNKVEIQFVSPLWDAVYYGHIEIVDFLLDAKVDVEKKMPYSNFFPLESALNHGSEKIAEKLVAHGAYRLEAGISALPLAKAKGFHGIVETLFQRDDPTTLAGKLHIGASSNDLELVTRCLQDPKVEINAKDFEENTALRLAIKSAKEDLGVIKLILQQPKILASIPNGIESAPIHLAALNGRMDIVRLLAAMPDFNINCRTLHRDTVLRMAAQAPGADTFTYVLNHPGLENPTRSDLHMLIRYIIESRDDDVQAEAMLQLLLRAGHQLDPSCIKIKAAIDKGMLLTASRLLSLISQAELLGQFGPLPHALMKHHPLVTTFIGELLARDVDIEEPTETWEWTRAPGDCTAKPLFLATVFAKNPDCMKMLLEAGADATSTVQVQVFPVRRWDTTRTMSLLSGLLSYVWRKRSSIVRHPIQYSIRADSAIQEDMFELEKRFSLLLQHGATLNQVSNGPSALRLVCLEAMESSSSNFLKWVMDNATASNVSIKQVDLLLSEFALVEDMPVQREIHYMLKGFKERLLGEGTHD